jgi:hypothetical protein
VYDLMYDFSPWVSKVRKNIHSKIQTPEKLVRTCNKIRMISFVHFSCLESNIVLNVLLIQHECVNEFVGRLIPTSDASIPILGLGLVHLVGFWSWYIPTLGGRLERCEISANGGMKIEKHSTSDLYKHIFLQFLCQ